MKIKQKVRQHRRDFTAIYECEHCGTEKEASGYDDAYFHQQVIPAMECATCGKAAGVATSSPSVPAWEVL